MHNFKVEMNFCRRCGAALQQKADWAYACEQGHTIFLAAPPAVGLVLLNSKNEILILKRAIEPGKGMLDIPGGFCDGPEALEDAIIREIKEEVGLESSDYTKPEFVLSGVDGYGFGGEIVPVLGVVYTAKMLTAKQPIAADDAASAEWVPASGIHLQKVHFSAVRDGLERVIGQL